MAQTAGFSSMIFDSSRNNGAFNISADGSRFSVDLENGSIIPREAKAAYVSLQQAYIYNNVTNVSSVNENNRLYIKALRETSGGGGLHNYVLQIPDGLYTPTTLNSELQNQMDNTNIDTSSEYPFEISYNTNNKITIKMNSTSAIIDFNDGVGLPNNKLKTMLGFSAGSYQIPTGSNAPFYFVSDLVPKFNVVEYYLVGCDFCQGIPVNQKYGGYLAQVSIDVQPGLQIISEPRHPIQIPCSRLVGNSGNKTFTFRLMDQMGRSINTNSETWSFRLKFEWYF
jgi:hypothetical protein